MAPAERAVQWVAPALAVLQVCGGPCQECEPGSTGVGVGRRTAGVQGCRFGPAIYALLTRTCSHYFAPFFSLPSLLVAPFQPNFNPRLVYHPAASVPSNYWSPGEDELLALGGCGVDARTSLIVH